MMQFTNIKRAFMVFFPLSSHTVRTNFMPSKGRLTSKIFFAGIIFISGALQHNTVLYAQSSQSRVLEKVNTANLELSISGLSPARMNLEPGLYNFRLQNRGVIGAFALELKDDKGNKLAESKTPKQAEKKTLLIQLTPGEHVIQIEGQPNWRCVVSVKPAGK